MRKLPVILSLLLLASTACAKEYGTYDPKSLVTSTDTSTGKQYGFNMGYLDRMMNDLLQHARAYPSQFDSQQDRDRAVRDVRIVSGMLDILIAVPAPSPEVLWRAALLNRIGHNLRIDGAAEKADALYRRLLTAMPGDPQHNYMYGVFLLDVGKSKEALVYLEKALSLGVTDATYTIGLAHLAAGDTEKALASLEDYKRRHPDDNDVVKLLEAVRSGKVQQRQAGADKKS